MGWWCYVVALFAIWIFIGLSHLCYGVCRPHPRSPSIAAVDKPVPLPFPLFGRSSSAAGPIAWLIVGLGNPGPKYAGTRHNIGFQIVDQLAAVEGVRFDEQRNKSVLARGQLAEQPIALMKPLTFMNNSGQAVGAIARFYKIPVAQILVIYDDLDLPTATLRLRPKGGSGGHKGMQSIIQHLGSQEFPRLRIGIDRPPGAMPVPAYVLQKFSQKEQVAMKQTIDNALATIRTLVTEGLETAMNRHN